MILLLAERALEHRDRPSRIALLRRDISEVEIDIALRDARLIVEALKKERPEGLLRSLEIALLVAQLPKISKHGDVCEIDTEGRLVFFERFGDLAHALIRASKPMMECRKLLAAPTAEALDDLFEDGD